MPSIAHLAGATAVLVAPLARPSSADIIVVTDGMDLASAVAGASDGDTVIIQGEGPFAGPVVVNESLTIQRGFGFDPPTIVGTATAPAISVSANSGDQIALLGLRLEPSQDGSLSLRLSGTGLFPSPTSLVVNDCTLTGDAEFLGTGQTWSDVIFGGCAIEGALVGRGIGDSRHELTLEDGNHIGTIELFHSGSGGISLQGSDLNVADGIDVNANNDLLVHMTLRRSTIRGPVEVLDSEPSSATILLESCVLEGTSQPAAASSTGLFVAPNSSLRGVNLTITGWGTGLAGNIGSTFSNCLIYGNDDDLADAVLPFQLDNTLVADGTYAGFPGILSATPLVGADFALIQTSAGIDAGDGLVPELGTQDLNGEPRVQDGDGDGVPTVNLGAVETVQPAPLASADAFNGNEINPKDLVPQNAPVLGTTFVCEVESASATLAAVVAIGTEAPLPLPIPGFTGELLLDLAAPTLLVDGLDFFSFPIPGQPQLLGAQLAFQAVRIDLPGGVPSLVLTNGLRVTVGL